jgi:hypothetical protein
VIEGYALVERLYERGDWLDWPVGRDVRGALRRVAVESVILRMINSSELKLRYRIASNSVDNCRHIEVLTERSRLTTSQVTTRRAMPRNALYRQNHGLSNQMLLSLPGFLDEEPAIGEDDRYYVLLTHGYAMKTPEFVCLGVPHPDMSSWISHVNLLASPSVADLPVVEEIDEEQLVQLKTTLTEMVKRGG